MWCFWRWEKHTLCAVIYIGVEYFGDDLICLKVDESTEGTIIPMPFAASIKSGAWELLSANYPNIHSQETVAYGEKNAKFLPLPHPRDLPPQATILNGIVFPTYRKDGPIQINTLSPIDTLSELVNAGISLHPNMTLNEVQNFLEANEWLSLLAKN